MKVLIVEDQQDKCDDIVNCLRSIFFNDMTVVNCQSLRSGLKELVLNGDFSLIILDMSMPNFDPSPDDPIGGTPESFAGSEFLAQMNLRGINIPVVVVTQYATFAKRTIELDDLDSTFKASYPKFYCGSVYYSSANDSWKNKLCELVGGLNE